MPVIRNTLISNHSRLGIWKITEQIDQLISGAHLTPDEAKVYQDFRSVSRRSEWLAVRVLLNEILLEKFQISYHKSGRPFILDKNEHLSVSHTDGYAAILLNHDFASGIDIQSFNPRLKRIAHRFLNHREDNVYQKMGQSLDFLHVIWGAKEALYKVHGNPLIFFKEHISITPFEVAKEGVITGKISYNEINEQYTIQYENLGDVMLVYLVDCVH